VHDDRFCEAVATSAWYLSDVEGRWDKEMRTEKLSVAVSMIVVFR
jgi:hypothetical protein